MLFLPCVVSPQILEFAESLGLVDDSAACVPFLSSLVQVYTDCGDLQGAFKVSSRLSPPVSRGEPLLSLPPPFSCDKGG